MIAVAIRRRAAAISLLALSLLLPLPVLAQVVGTVSQYSGVLMAQKRDGALKLLRVGSEVELGDTLVTQGEAYALVRFTDGSQVTLRPNSRLKIDEYYFQDGVPERDNAVLRLIKGGLRTLTGLIGKRGNRDAYSMRTSLATVGIRGTHYGALLCQGDCGGLPGPGAAQLADGFYVDVVEGAIVVSNPAGAEVFSPGQFGFVRDAITPPVQLPADPGGMRFTPPRMETAPGNGGAGGGNDCVITP